VFGPFHSVAHSCLDLARRQTQAISVPIEQNTLIITLGVLQRLNPLAGAETRPQAPDEANATILCVAAIMLAHDRLDGLGGLISVVERNGADVVVQDMGLDDAVEELTTDEAKFAVDCCGGSTSVGPGRGCVVGESWVGVLEEGDHDWNRSVLQNIANRIEKSHRASC
jgi:hypothetical protein